MLCESSPIPSALFTLKCFLRKLNHSNSYMMNCRCLIWQESIKSDRCLKCRSGTYDFVGQGSCLACPKGATCINGTDVFADKDKFVDISVLQSLLTKSFKKCKHLHIPCQMPILRMSCIEIWYAYNLFHAAHFAELGRGDRLRLRPRPVPRRPRRPGRLHRVPEGDALPEVHRRKVKILFSG